MEGWLRSWGEETGGGVRDVQELLMGGGVKTCEPYHFLLTMIFYLHWYRHECDIFPMVAVLKLSFWLGHGRDFDDM